MLSKNLNSVVRRLLPKAWIILNGETLETFIFKSEDQGVHVPLLNFAWWQKFVNTLYNILQNIGTLNIVEGNESV